MSNHFPAAPTVTLAGVSYTAVLPRPSLVPGSALDYAGAGATLNYSTPTLGISFTFAAGNPGSFDQDGFEAQFSLAIDAVCQVVASMAGTSLTSVRAGVTVARQWDWAGISGGMVTADTMPYPRDSDACRAAAETASVA